MSPITFILLLTYIGRHFRAYIDRLSILVNVAMELPHRCRLTLKLCPGISLMPINEVLIPNFEKYGIIQLDVNWLAMYGITK